ncbi:MAG: ArdC family protein [Chitinophagales bacterium]
MNKESLYKYVNESILKLIENNLQGNPQRWINIKGGRHQNPITNTRYKGINLLLLSISSWISGYYVNNWFTLNQVNQKEGKVKKGEHSTPIIFADKMFIHNSTGKIIYQVHYEELKPKQQEEYNKRWFNRAYHVFNVAQVDIQGYEECDAIPKISLVEIDSAAESLVLSSNAVVDNRTINKAYYDRVANSISIPKREQFNGTGDYYSTIFHELIHWTGHETRLNRLQSTSFESEHYAFEELVAELGAAYLCAYFGYDKMMTTNADYLRLWLKTMKEEPTFVLKAAGAAQKATEHLLYSYELMQRAA